MRAGRLSVLIEADGERPAQGHVAAFELRGDGQNGELRLLSPLGVQVARARWAPGVAELATADGARSYSSLDRLAEEALGERVPLAALPDWIAGRPWREAAHEPVAYGFVQLGWQVDLSRMAEGRIVARRETAPPVTVRVILEAGSS